MAHRKAQPMVDNFAAWVVCSQTTTYIYTIEQGLRPPSNNVCQAKL